MMSSENDSKEEKEINNIESSSTVPKEYADGESVSKDGELKNDNEDILAVKVENLLQNENDDMLGVKVENLPQKGGFVAGLSPTPPLGIDTGGLKRQIDETCSAAFRLQDENCWNDGGYKAKLHCSPSSSGGDCQLYPLYRKTESFTEKCTGFGLINIVQNDLPCDIYVEETMEFSSLRTVNESPPPFSILCHLHTVSGGRAMIWLEITDQTEADISEYHTKLLDSNSLAFVSFDEMRTNENEFDNELCMVALCIKNDNIIKNGFMIYGVPKYSLLKSLKDGENFPSVLQNIQLCLVFGVEHSLLRMYDLVKEPPPREAELAMLHEFDTTLNVSLPGGIQVSHLMEETISDQQCELELAGQEEQPETKKIKLDPEEEQQQDQQQQEEEGEAKLNDYSKMHPVLRLQSPEGELIFTKVPIGNGKVESRMIHIRPGWRELHKYMIEGNNSGTDGKRAPLFRVFVHFKTEINRTVALEVWRLLDKDSKLMIETGGWKSSTKRIYSRNIAPKRSLEVCIDHYPWDSMFTFCIDYSARWKGKFGISKLWPVRPYDPYIAPNDFGLASALHAIHNVRNSFFELIGILDKELKLWVDSLLDMNQFMNSPQPSVPDLENIIQVQKHRWLQEFQTVQSKNIPKALASARDYADPLLRNKWHLIIDTNVLHNCASDKFEFFKTLEHTQSQNIVIVIPFATISELDWQKHNVKNSIKLQNATQSIRFLNRQVQAGSRFIVMQSVEEDSPNLKKHQSIASHNARNDMRIFEAAKARQTAGCKTLVISGDINLQNVCLSANVPALRFESLWKMLCDSRYQKLGPEQWIQVLQKNRQKAHVRKQKDHANKLIMQ